MAKRGISLLDLASPFPGAQALIPDELASKLENFAVVEHHATTSAGVHVHEGVIQPISDLGFPALRNWPVEVPGLNTGLPFRLVRTRNAAGSGQNLEPAASSAFLDLVVDRIAITVPGLRPATLVPTAPAVAAHLLPDASHTSVRIVGSGVVRIDLSGTGDLVRFVDWPDPFDPAAPSGAVFGVTFEPASFFVGGSQIGLTVDRLVFDASAQTTPPDIIARGQTPAWQGISIAAATLYLPPDAPLVDQVNVSVKDVLLGSPAGLQGEIQVELGRTPINAAAVEFLQDLQGEHPLSPTGTGRELDVPLLVGTPETARVRATLNPATLGTSTQPQMKWTLPDDTEVDANDTSWFTTSVGETLEGIFSEEVNGERVSDSPNTYTFTQSEAEVQHPAMVNVHVAATDIANVVFVSGTAQALSELEFSSALNPADAMDLRWQYGTGTDALNRTGPDFVLDPDASAGTAFLVVTDAKNRARRIRVDVLSAGALLIGAADGVHDASGALVEVRGVTGTYDLNAYDKDGSLTTFGTQATASGTSVTVPDGGLAEVSVQAGSGTDPDAPANPVTEDQVRRLQVRFGYNDTAVEAWGVYVPTTQEGTIEASVRKWASFFPGATFVVIGRCCDIGPDAHNADLATERANAVVPWVTGPGTVLSRGEQTAPSGAMATAQDAITPGLSSAEKAAGRLIDSDYSADERAAWGDGTTGGHREEYRRVDIYAVGGTYTPPAGEDPTAQQVPPDTQHNDPATRRAYVPGKDADQVPDAEPRDPKLPFLIRLAVKWDSPTVTTLADAIPTQAEFTFEWATSNVTTVPQPGGGDSPVGVRAPSQAPGTTTEVYTLTGKWDYDSRSGQTVMSISIASSGDPKGLAAIDSSFLAIAMALAPALLAGIGAAGIDGAAVRAGALALATGILAPVSKDTEVVIHSAEIEQRQRSLTDLTGSRTRILLDYTAAVGFDIDAGGLGRFSTDDGHPLKVRYHKAGLEFDDSKTEWYEKFGLVYEDVSFEVSDPGRWNIEGPLGELLQVTATRAGVGSTWFECDLEFALDLGVVSITGATVRATFGDDGFSAELRGLGLAVEIPGVLRGAGRLVLGDGGAFKASLELDLISVGAKALGALAFDPANDFLSIGLGLILPVGIPLASTGLGIFGFLGLFVSNGRRALPSGMDNDPVGREITWYRDTPYEDKFEPHRGEWAIGLGMIVGTLPDQAFTFNATGMFVVAFPDPAVIFGIDAKLIKQPEVTPQTQGSVDDPSLQILGLIAVDDTAVMVGVRGTYTIPKVLELKLPIDGYFPFPSTPKDAYVRIGSDGVVSEGRPGDPVTIKLLPGTLDMQAWSFLMVESRQLHKLGGDDRFNFDGFSVGFGAGFEIKWSAGPIKLEASAKLLVGFGVNPFLLKGGIFVKGELDLVVVSVSATGELICTIWGKPDDLKVNLSGKFCGKVDFFFFSVEGCVGVEIGDSITPSAPPPDPPVGKVSLTDRRGYTTALPTTGTPGPDQTVWPDTVPVIEFTHHLDVALSGGAFSPGAPPAGPVWSGTSELKYAYRLTGIELTPDGQAPLAGPLESGWWLPTNRPGVLEDGDVAVSDAEGVFLALLSWDPGPWSYWLTDGGAGTDGDPAQTPGRVCDPPVTPKPNCALGRLGVRTGVDAVRVPTADPGSPPFPSRFALLGRERAFGRFLGDLAPVLAATGLAVVPGQVTAGAFGDDVWWLARITRYGYTERTTEFRAQIAPEITTPELVLLVCRDLRQRPPTTPALTCEQASEHFPDVGMKLGSSAALGEVKLAAASGELYTVAESPAAAMGVRFPDAGLEIDLPTAASIVRLAFVLHGGPLKVVALDASGKEVDVVQTPSDQRALVTVTLQGAGITRVEVDGGSSEASLVSVCWGTAPDVGHPADTGALPLVRGTVAGGGEQDWPGKVLAQVRTGAGLCQLVSYAPDDAKALWSAVRIREWAGTEKGDAGQVGIVRLCGVTGPASAQAEANSAFAAYLKDVMTVHALDADDPVPARRDLLQPATGYTLTVSWAWQGWLKTDSQPEPPTVPDAGSWTDGTPVSYHFRTADHAVVTGTPPAELVDEKDFDPRSLLRYLIAFDPETGSAPHLLDDTLLVHLAIDHGDQLAGLYGRSLQLRLRRTDPPPGSLAETPHPPNETVSVTWGPLFDAYRPVGQLRFLQAVREAPCLDEPSLGGTTGEVTADLVPGAWYDLILLATPTGDPDAEDAVISRTHFQASRYHGVDDLLASLGLTTDRTWPIIAGDAIVTAGLPSGGLVVGDGDLDSALASVGMDPWPLPDQARTSVLWFNDAGVWKLAGVLLEAAEPIIRTGRTALDLTAASYSSVALTPLRQNLAGTRVLLAPSAPVAVPAAAELSVTLTKTVTDRTGATTATASTGRRAALGVPRTVYAEAGS